MLFRSLPKETVIGALADYISTENEKFQPMNANFGILPQLENRIKDKWQRYEKLGEKALQKLDETFTNKGKYDII